MPRLTQEEYRRLYGLVSNPTVRYPGGRALQSDVGQAMGDEIIPTVNTGNRLTVGEVGPYRRGWDPAYPQTKNSIVGGTVNPHLFGNQSNKDFWSIGAPNPYVTGSAGVSPRGPIEARLTATNAPIPSSGGRSPMLDSGNDWQGTTPIAQTPSSGGRSPMFDSNNDWQGNNQPSVEAPPWWREQGDAGGSPWANIDPNGSSTIAESTTNAIAAYNPTGAETPAIPITEYDETPAIPPTPGHPPSPIDARNDYVGVEPGGINRGGTEIADFGGGFRDTGMQNSSFPRTDIFGGQFSIPLAFLRYGNNYPSVSGGNAVQQGAVAGGMWTDPHTGESINLDTLPIATGGTTHTPGGDYPAPGTEQDTMDNAGPRPPAPQDDGTGTTVINRRNPIDLNVDFNGGPVNGSFGGYPNFSGTHFDYAAGTYVPNRPSPVTARDPGYGANYGTSRAYGASAASQENSKLMNFIADGGAPNYIRPDMPFYSGDYFNGMSPEEEARYFARGTSPPLTAAQQAAGRERAKQLTTARGRAAYFAANPPTAQSRGVGTGG